MEDILIDRNLKSGNSDGVVVNGPDYKQRSISSIQPRSEQMQGYVSNKLPITKQQQRDNSYTNFDPKPTMKVDQVKLPLQRNLFKYNQQKEPKEFAPIQRYSPNNYQKKGKSPFQQIYSGSGKGLIPM